MEVAAILFAIITVLVGVFVLGDLVGEAGSGVKRLAASHVGIALTGVILLLVALVDASRGTAWVSFAALVVAGSVGLMTLTLNRPPGDTGTTRKEQGHLPLPVVVIHGAAALLTLLLVLAAISTVGAVR